MMMKDEPLTLHGSLDIVGAGLESKYFLEDYHGQYLNFAFLA